ncbi:hypothetical protein J8L85_03200 [Maribacter sp. MMG018]|uniref:hypothetical protein n=1 Tax=Maribacter sp. MMG018 TaxID=2822688 RepID=UPI001B390A9D|nr:hypothetical protein [Maribacter sp. MMG018]MBQ4913428.1 hypothetical protein [Maribacter sp. MMG018]
MISSIFGKTKPINFIIVAGFVLFFYLTVQNFLFEQSFLSNGTAQKILVLGSLLFSVFVVDFIVKKNKLTGPNSYAILFFAILLVVFPESLGDDNAVLCSFFLLLATRRLLSVKSLKSIRLKIFDASLWILVSSIFYDWAVLYLTLVMVTIYVYDAKNIKNWLAIFSAVLCFSMILVSTVLLLDKTDFLTDHYDFSINIEAIYPLHWTSSIKVSLYIFINVVLSIWTFLKLSNAGLGKIITIRLITFSFLLGLIVNLLVISRNGNAIMVTFFPSIILLTNYVESIRKEKFRELVLLGCILVPIVVFVSRLLI